MTTPIRQAIVSTLLLLLAVPCYSQYKQFAIQDFEDPQKNWPDILVHGHHSTPLTTRLLDWPSSDYGPGLAEGAAADVIGGYGLELRPLETDPHLSVMFKRALNRQKLGPNGAALFQVDFYFPEDTASHPTMAILGNASDDTGRGGYRFYRFGIDRDRIYFSFTNGKSSPDIYLRQPLSEFNLPTPGWHRLQMIFNGQEEILCAIDGQITSFSPIKDATLSVLEPGVMVTRPKEGGEKAVYADNLEIMWTANAADDPPVAPWLLQNTSSLPVRGLQANLWNLGGFEWTLSPSEAWKQANEESKVIFAVFHGDDQAANEEVMKILSAEDAKFILSQCVPLRVDVGTNSGQVFAQRYSLGEFPSVAVIRVDGRMTNSVHIQTDSGIEWTGLYQKLSGT
ncbi:MAG: hypothetical protein RLY93_04900 [Sumerlaeia bacterium]